MIDPHIQQSFASPSASSGARRERAWQGVSERKTGCGAIYHELTLTPSHTSRNTRGRDATLTTWLVLPGNDANMNKKTQSHEERLEETQLTESVLAQDRRTDEH